MPVVNTLAELWGLNIPIDENTAKLKLICMTGEPASILWMEFSKKIVSNVFAFEANLVSTFKPDLQIPKRTFSSFILLPKVL